MMAHSVRFGGRVSSQLSSVPEFGNVCFNSDTFSETDQGCASFLDTDQFKTRRWPHLVADAPFASLARGYLHHLSIEGCRT